MEKKFIRKNCFSSRADTLNRIIKIQPCRRGYFPFLRTISEYLHSFYWNENFTDFYEKSTTNEPYLHQKFASRDFNTPRKGDRQGFCSRIAWLNKSRLQKQISRLTLFDCVFCNIIVRLQHTHMYGCMIASESKPNSSVSPAGRHSIGSRRAAGLGRTVRRRK